MKKYTIKLHKERVKTMLKTVKLTDMNKHCPGMNFFKLGKDFLSNYDKTTICDTCQDFIESNGCPCEFFGCEEAVKRTYKALKESEK